MQTGRVRDLVANVSLNPAKVSGGKQGSVLFLSDDLVDSVKL